MSRAGLNADYALAEAIAQTPDVATGGRSLETLSPDLQTADLLGLERLLGRNDLIDVGFLERGFRASRAVGRITIRCTAGDLEGFGTGFFISPRLLLTNNHVPATAEGPTNSYVEFDYQAGVDGAPLVPAAFRLRPGEFFVTDPLLDFSVVAVEDTNAHGQPLGQYGFLRLVEQEGKAIAGELMNIVGHPNGEPKQLALRENRLVDVLDLFVHYQNRHRPRVVGFAGVQRPVGGRGAASLRCAHTRRGRRLRRRRRCALDPEHGEGGLAWIANEGIRNPKTT